MAALYFDYAFLPQGWSTGVRIDLEGGRIAAAAARAKGDGAQYCRGIAVPGLPNLHSHTFQRGMAGLAEHRGDHEDNFWTWRQVMYHFLGVLTPDDIETIAAFAFIEMLESGFTSVAEFHYLHNAPDGRSYDNPAELSERIIAAASATGIGLTLLPVLYSASGFGGAPTTEGQRRFSNSLDRFLDLAQRAEAAADKHGFQFGIAPHSLRAVPPEVLKALLAARRSGPVHIHVAEQMREVEDCIAWSGRRPVEWLFDHAAVDSRWCLIHATHASATEIRLMAKSGAVAGLCPITEANLGDGIFSAKAYLEGGGLFGVGSDSQIEINAPGELRQLEYSQRLSHQARNVLCTRPGSSTGRELYERALTGGARALARAAGALAPEKLADIVVLDSEHPNLASGSADRWLDAYLFTSPANIVRDVFVAGQHVVSNGRHRDRERIEKAYKTVLARVADF
jgi:formimidoylglutamate deiminase